MMKTRSIGRFLQLVLVALRKKDVFVVFNENQFILRQALQQLLQKEKSQIKTHIPEIKEKTDLLIFQFSTCISSDGSSGVSSRLPGSKRCSFVLQR